MLYHRHVSEWVMRSIDLLNIFVHQLTQCIYPYTLYILYICFHAYEPMAYGINELELELWILFLVFLAHLSRRLKWAIVIAHRPSSVRPSVVRRRPSSSSSSVNFHIFNFFSRTAWQILMKFGRDEVLMVPYKCCCFSARSPQGRIQGGAKIGHRGSPSSRNFFFRPEGYSDKPNA